MTDTPPAADQAPAAATSSQPSVTYIRREVRHLLAGEETLKWYRRAVAAMKARGAEDKTGWAYQAAIHGTRLLPPQRLWNQCKHGGWFFLPWHRMYVYYFERIVRQAVIEVGGPGTWALPYWNYGLGEEYASIPEDFRNPTIEGEANALYVAERAEHINQGARLSKKIASAASALARLRFTGSTEFGGGEAPSDQQFWSQTGALEQTPHNDVHNAVGGSGPMGDTLRAALDPIFWLHHANIDRIWAQWIALGQGHANPTDPAWLTQSFGFYDVGRSPVSRTCEEVLDTIGKLSYTYDSLAVPSESAPLASVPPSSSPHTTLPGPPALEIVGASEQPVQLVGNAEHVPVAIDARASSAALAGAQEPRRIFLNVEDIQAERNPGTVYGIYVNLPEDPSPQALAEHHAGNVSFFGVERARDPRADEHSHSLRVSVEITGLVSELQQRGEWNPQQLHVSLRPIRLIVPGGQEGEEVEPQGAPGEDPPVQIGRVSLSFER